MKPALLVIDVQNAWLDESEGLKRSVELHIKEMNDAISLFREKGLPIIVIYHTDKGGSPEPGTKEFEFHPSVDVRETDARVVKNYPNAFNKTELGSKLRKLGCDTVLLCGLSASGCVLATCLGAVDKDLSAYLVRDAVAGPREDLVRFAEEVCDSISVAALSQFL